jgi:serine/threonine protein phosphatase PrpC
MGGHAAGEVASRLAVESVLEKWTGTIGGQPLQILRGAVRWANSVVFGASLDQDKRGMGTTLTALAFAGREALVAHVGDSRCYLVRDGQASQLTSDHSRVGEMLRMRLITPEQAATHPARSQLTKSLGAEPAVQVDVVRKEIAVGDCYVLCSDGLWDLVSRNEIARTVVEGSPEDATASLTETALERGAPDNVTVIVARVTAEEPMGPAQRARPRLSFFGFGG